MSEWEYWTVEVQETANRAEVMKQALAEGGRFGYELVTITPITASGWDEQMFSIGGPSASVRVATVGYILTFKRPKAAPPTPG